VEIAVMTEKPLQEMVSLGMFCRSLSAAALCWWMVVLPMAPTVARADANDDVAYVHKWAEAAFGKPVASSRTAAEMLPANELSVVRKSHKVLLNRTVWDTPLMLGDERFEHGIYMDAPAAIEVRLSQPAVEFVATVGMDNNPNTQGRPESPSARFHLLVDGRKIFSTPVRRLRDGPLPVRVPLDGVRQFVLDVDDGGNGRGHDQCVWADAAVKLADGSVRLLDEFPLGRRRTRRTTAPFSFSYGGRPSEVLLPTWDYSVRSESSEKVMRRTVSYRCPETGLLLQCVITTFEDAAAVDWVFYLTNEGGSDTPVIDSFLPLDSTFTADTESQFTLRWSNGDSNSPESFLPRDEPLAVEAVRQFAASGGRSSNGSGGGVLPFFNCLGPEGGWVMAVGWSGQWTAEFVRESDGGLTIGAGMETTHFRLRPGQRVRSPRIVLLRYPGREMILGHNRFRRLMLEHYVQRRDGVPVPPPVAHNTAATVYRSGTEATEENQLAIIDKAAKLGAEAYWMDAYWYPRPWYANVGNWYCRENDFPRGLRPLADAAHREKMQFVLWFEPERVAPGTRFDREHPEFLLKVSETGNRLYNLGDPAARRFLIDFLDERIKRWGVDIYRNDFNVDPLPYWRRNDTPDTQGITEMLYVEGLYETWRELMRRNPRLLIDNCASGGRRIDLEMCSLSWPLWRSDLNDIGQGLKGPEYWPMMARADQVHVAGLGLYIPFQSGPLWDMHPYSFRSAMTSSVVLYERILQPEFPDQLARDGIAELKQLRPLFQGDVYPLMDLTARQDDWYAYQLSRPDLKRGCALFFRRPKSPDESAEVVLRDVDPKATYRVSVTGETYQQGPWREVPGRELLQLKIEIDSKPGSALVRYERVAD
jgi:alpha-galactosidase